MSKPLFNILSFWKVNKSTVKQASVQTAHLLHHLHSAEAFHLQPGFDLLGRGVVGDVSSGLRGAAWRSLELFLSAATEGESVHQLVLNLLHVGLAAWWVTRKRNLALTC